MNSDGDSGGDRARGFLCALLGTIVMSSAPVTAKYGLQGFNPETFSLIWTSSATICAFLIVLATGQWRRMALRRSSSTRMVLIGVATGAGMMLNWAGLARLDPSFAAFLWRFMPVLTILLGALLLGERLTVTEILPLGLMVLGGCVGAVGRWHLVGTGVVLILLSCIASAAQWLIAKTEVSEVNPSTLAFYRAGIGALVIALWTAFTGKAEFGVDTRYWAVTLLGALLSPCVSFLLIVQSYRYWDLSRSSMVMTLQPLFVLPLACVLLGQFPTKMELIGGLAILIGGLWLACVHS